MVAESLSFPLEESEVKWNEARDGLIECSVRNLVIGI